ncbi:unnamed protein product [Malus baccata var. baccata]
MEILISIASKIGECLVTPIGKEFGYLINYHSNLQNLEGEINKLFEKRDVVQGLVNAAKRNGESIKPDVHSWLKNVNNMIQKVSHFEDEINKKRRCMYRWSLSWKASKITRDVLQLQNEGTFENVVQPAPPPEIWSAFKEGFKNFKSRMVNMNELIEGLKREEVRMIGICGLGGVGKTTMVKEIIKRLDKMNLFDKIVMATVSQSPSTRMIQSEIAQEIGLKFEDESESGRARRLHRRLIEIKRILIVLDDVWTELDFEAIGLPCGDTHKGCKILLTSRDLEVCNRMGSQQLIVVPILTREESWELFRETVGESFDDPDLRSIAKEVVNECAGLPIAIVTVGRAQKRKKKHEWVDALNQLRKSIPESIPGLDGKESDEARSCLLLCCLFPEDYNIPIEYLVRHGWGREYFSSNVTFEEARNRVHYLVDKLQRRFLLLDSSMREAAKMHDIVRDVAISIASRDPHGFLIRSHAKNNGWPNLATCDHYTTISLVGNLEIPVSLKCPKLELLQTMNGRFSEGSMDIICTAMKELKVLALVEMYNFDSSRSPGVLKNLRTLCLDNSIFYGLSTDIIGDLENLEILNFRGCDSMRELPREFGQLKKLRLLDMTNCTGLQLIPNGILSSLSFDGWELETGGEDKGMASISEVMSLSDHLKFLAVHTPNVIHLLPKDVVLKSLTIRFHIHLETQPDLIRKKKRERRGVVESQTVRLLVKNSESLKLRHVKNLYVLTDLDQEGIQHSKVLSLEDCPNTEYLANGTNGTQQTLFPRMQTICVRWMLKLKAICPNNQLPKSFLINLRSLELKYCINLVISSCDQMEEIVSKQQRKHEKAVDMIAFHKLTKLTLQRLDSFVGFFQAKPRGIFEKSIFPSKCISWLQSIEEVNMVYMKHKGVLFDLKSHIVMDGQVVQIFSELCKLVIIRCSFTHLWKNIPFGFQAFQNLRYLEIKWCSLEYVFLLIIAGKLLNLEEVKISACPDMVTIVRNTEENKEEATKDMILFPKLNTFELVDLPRLTSLCPEGFTFLWSSTKNMHVKKCDKLKTLGAVILQRKKLDNKFEKDSTSHDFSTSPTRSSNWCPDGCPQLRRDQVIT